MRLMLVCALVALAFPSQAQQWLHEFRDLPTEVVEGAELRFRVAYRVPAERGTVKLHAEMKALDNVVHAGVVREVSGAGLTDISIPVPVGVLRGELVVALWFGEDWRRAHAPAVHSRVVRALTIAEAQAAEAAQVESVRIRERLGLRPDAPAVAIVTGGWAGRDARLTELTRQSVEAVGLRTVLIGPHDLANPAVLRPAEARMLIIPDAHVYPGAGLAGLDRYLRAGGHLIALGAPAFDRLVQELDGEWLDSQQIDDLVRRSVASSPILDVGATTAGDWRRSTNRTADQSEWRVAPSGAAGVGSALHVRMRNLTGWDTLTGPPLIASPSRDHNLVIFQARGGPRTTALSIEVREQDGSRWIAVVPLSRSWRRYAVHVADFALWDPEGTSGRGQRGDRLHLERAREITAGLAFSHTRLPHGAHEYWFADPGTGAGPNWERFRPLTLDTLSPVHKYHAVRGARRVDDGAGRALVGVPAPPLPAQVLSTHPRPSGTGFDKGRAWRWTPLLRVVGRQGVAGTLATLLSHRDRDAGFRRGKWASFTAVDPAWYARPDVQRYIAALARRMLDGPIFVEGGARFFGLFPEEDMELGARVQGGAGAVRFTVTTADGAQTLFRAEAPAAGAGEERIATATWRPGRLTAARYRVRTELLAEGRVVDVLEHEVTVRHPRRPRFMTAENGKLLVDGKPWYPHGLNYMPSSGIALDDGPMFERWMSAQSYDPEVIERDLARVKAMRMNMVSLFIYTHDMHSRNLVDILNRCDAHGLKVNLSLRPGTPLDFEWPGIGEIIRVNRLSRDATVFAYDIAWEPTWGHYAQRKRWDPEWERWIVERYGSIEAAERDWGDPAPRVEGAITGPSDADLARDSSIPRVVAAYRRFLDDFLSRRHMEARQKIRTVAPHQLISFRKSTGGDPTVPTASMPYDFAGLARSMDFMGPEAYGRIGEWEQVKSGWFTAAYSRMVAPGRPVVWTEFGYTSWDPPSASPASSRASFAERFERRFYPPATVAFIERFYRHIYNMVLRSGASGTVLWWYPGGFRVGENSDFGIINPDGSWRGLSRIVAEYAPRFARHSPPREPDAWITVDRDAHPDGLQGIYAAHRDAFWRLIEEGRFPGLRHEGIGTNSATAPLVAVGNTPLNGSNPPKHLNAEYEVLQVMDATGRWTDVRPAGGSIRVAAGRPVRVRAVLGNNGAAAWLSPRRHRGDGAVYLAARGPSGETLMALPGNVPTLGTSGLVEGQLPALAAAAQVEFQCVARGRSRFGERWTVVLQPVSP
ncbi:MAG TPA: hypothetical protein VLH79_16070 [Chthonomonadales bacterium]|nr:hypothetical protein [Chthonomonadales bacterium]